MLISMILRMVLLDLAMVVVAVPVGIVQISVFVFFRKKTDNNAI